MDNNPHGVTWLDNRTSPVYRKFIENLFDHLGQYYDRFIRKTSTMPFYYGERPQIGHLAQAAGRCQYISVQDYNVNVQGKLKRRLKYHYVPDLLIWVPARGQEPHTCVFEAKVKHWTSIDPREGRLTSVISSDLAEANVQISQHGYEEGRFYCALAVVKIYCPFSKWEHLKTKPSLYVSKTEGLLDEPQKALDRYIAEGSKVFDPYRKFVTSGLSLKIGNTVMNFADPGETQSMASEAWEKVFQILMGRESDGEESRGI